MSATDRFIDLVESICHRSSMYVCGGSFYEICAYISGYAEASPDCPLSGDGWNAFNEFVCAAYRFPKNYVWPYVLKHCSRDDDEATARLQSLLVEFAKRSMTESHDDIVQDMISRACIRKEGVPEKAWRRFSRALLRGKKDEIEPLIQAHPDAEVLWAGAYPNDVASLLDQIDESYSVSQISGSEEDGEVTIITPDFGPMTLRLIGGDWRIDATKIIECRKAMK
jgi:hypothetical protein